jgi:hypothetical protein
MIIKTFLIAALLAVFSVPALAFFDYFMRIDDAKYLQGDCITPTDQSLSFYGHYARVEGVIRSNGTAETGVYYLSFPVFKARTPLHAMTIDQKTQRVDSEFCQRQGVD